MDLETCWTIPFQRGAPDEVRMRSGPERRAPSVKARSSGKYSAAPCLQSHRMALWKTSSPSATPPTSG